MSWVLVVGYGSIGRRHTQNLLDLGCRDVRVLRRAQPANWETPPGVGVYHSLDEALADRPWLVVVCTPTACHEEPAVKALAADAHVLLEKPVSHDLESAGRILEAQRQASGLVSMAYCFRYHPLYQALDALVASGELGRIFHVKSWQVSYLPDWHPWEDYRQSYAARPELGGGVVRTLDHEIDHVLRLLGEPLAVSACLGSLSGLVEGVEDTADLVLRYGERRQASIHLCFARRDRDRGLWVAGEDATAVLDWRAGCLEVRSQEDGRTAYRLSPEYDLNKMYRDTLDAALRAFRVGQAAVPLQAGMAALQVGMAAQRSSQTRREIPWQ